MKLTLQGLQEAQNDNAKWITVIQPSGAFGRAIKYATTQAHRYVVGITHVWRYKGGGLRASHRMEIFGIRGRIYIDASAVNPRGQRPSIYGPVEEARGGSHAFYHRTTEEAGPRIAREAAQMVRVGLK